MSEFYYPDPTPMFSDTEKKLLEAQQRHKDALARGDEYHADILGKTIDFLQKKLRNHLTLARSLIPYENKMGFVFYNQNKNIYEVYTLNPVTIQFPRIFEYLDEAIKHLKDMDYFHFDHYTTTPLHHTSLAQKRQTLLNHAKFFD